MYSHMGNVLDSREVAELRIMAKAAVELIQRRDGLRQSDIAGLMDTSQQVISLAARGLPKAPIRVLRLLTLFAGLIRVQDSQRAQAGAQPPTTAAQ